MICPHCGNEIKKVKVFSEVWQRADVDASGSIVSYGPIKEFLDIVDIEHDVNEGQPECHGSVIDIIGHSFNACTCQYPKY